MIELPHIVPPDFKNHWDETLTDDQYHSDRTAIGSGRLKHILKSPASLYESFIKEPTEPNDHIRFGRLFHYAVLEPAKFLETYILMPDFGSMRTTAAKEAKQKWLSEVPKGKVPCTEEELEKIEGMSKALLQHTDAKNSFSNGKPEICGWYRDPKTGIKLRIKPDFLSFDCSVLSDVKTTQSCERKEFSKSIWSYRYDFQMAMYCEGVYQITGKRPEYPTFIAIEKKPPYEVAVYVLDDAAMEKGLYDYHRALEMLKECLESNEWKRYQINAENIGLPAWAFNE